MDYILLLLAIVCFAAQFAFTKLYEGAVRQSATASLVMLTVTSAIGALLFLAVSGFRLSFSIGSTLWALALAVIMIPYYMLGVKVLSLGSLAIYSMFMMLGGMLVPFFYGVLFLKEPVTLGKGLGTLLLAMFIILQAVLPAAAAGKQNKGKKSLFFLLCVVIFFINGFTGVIAKAHQLSAAPVDEASFTALSCGFTALLSLGMLLLPAKEAKGEAVKGVLTKKPLMIIAALGAAAYTGSFLHLMAAKTVPASVQFPLVSGGVIILSALVSAFLFKEKVNRQEWFCVGGAFLATFLFAF